MTSFSQSFIFGDTLLEIENDVTIHDDNDLEIIPASQSKKTCSNVTNGHHSTIKERLKDIESENKSKRKTLKKNKSDSILHEKKKHRAKYTSANNLSNNNYSELFTSSFDFEQCIMNENLGSINVSQIETSIERSNKSNRIKTLLNKTSTDCSLENAFLVEDSENEANSSKLIPIKEEETKETDPQNEWELSNIFNDVLQTENEFDNIIMDDVNNVNRNDIDNVTFMEESGTYDEELKSCKTEVQISLHDDEENINQHKVYVNSNESIIMNIPNNSISTDEISANNSDHIYVSKPSIIEHHNISVAVGGENPNINESVKHLNNIENWNLPNAIVEQYKLKGIHNMFDWQVKCLSNPKVLFQNTNLVYNAPTSAGKTLVSEILIIKNILERKKKAIIILPFISVVREKMFYLQDLLTPAGICVEGFYGGYKPAVIFDKIHVAICTIEKANSIVNKLLEQDKISDIGIIVVDEIHLISDPGRGYILELLIAKILYVCRKFQYQIQVITMSATISNVNVLIKWLGAEYYFTDFRPIALYEMIKIGPNIYDNKMKIVRTLEMDTFLQIPNDQDNIGQLCMETILENCSVIVFCPSKNWCESLALQVANLIYIVGKKKNNTISEKLRQQINMKAIDEIKLQLKNCPTGLDSVLEKTISYSCAFHHAGLTMDERDIIESGFKSNIIRVIVATSTLSSGVNLPARRVIIRTPLFGGKMMSTQTYKQMIGRAGRTGKDTLGESILLCNDANAKDGKHLITAKLNALTSCLDDQNHEHLKRAILEIIASGIVKTKIDLECFIKCTLIYSEKNYKFSYFENTIVKNEHSASQNEHENIVNDPIYYCMKFLEEYEFIRIQLNENSNELNYISTRLGYACLASSMPPNDGFLLFSELQKARQCFALESDLHAIYLVTPFSVCSQIQNLDWLFYLDLWEKLPNSLKKVGQLIGIKESFLIKAMRGNSKLDYKLLQIHIRFYTALALQELVNEKPITIVAEKYKCSRGLLQSLQQQSATFAGIVTSFCTVLNWTMLSLIVSQFKERLFFGVHHDLIDLLKLQSLNGIRARVLFDNGVKTLVDLANSDALTIENILYNSISFELRKNDDENEFDARQRNNFRNMYVTGKAGITISEAASLLISQARSYLEQEMGIYNVNWSKKTETNDNNNTFDINNGTNSMHVNDNNNNDNNNSTSTNSLSKQNCKSKNSNSFLIDIENNMNKRTNTNQSDRLIISQNEIDCNGVDSIDIQNTQSITHNQSATEIRNETKTVLNKSNLSHLNIIDVFANKLLMATFQKEIGHIKEIGMSIGINNIAKIKLKPIIIGNQLLPFDERQKLNSIESSSKNFNCIFDDLYYLDGISFYFQQYTIYYLNLQNNSTNTMDEVDSGSGDSNRNDNDSIGIKIKLEFIERIFACEHLTFRICDAKEQCKILMKAIPNIKCIAGKLEDPKIAHWLLQPEESLTLIQMVLQYTPVNAMIIEPIKNNIKNNGIGMNSNSSISAKIRCSIESFLVYHLLKEQIEKIQTIASGNLYRFFKDVEMPIQHSLALMELIGFSVNHKDLTNIMSDMKYIMLKLENKIYDICGRRFNIGSTKEVAKILGIRNNNKSSLKAKISTSKQVLQKMCDPLSDLIIQYRKLSATLVNTIQPMLGTISNDNKIHGNSISCTVTGRIFMQEPNIQNVTKDFEVICSEFDKTTISCRSAFKTEDGQGLIAADFCQLELRVLTHLSEDVILMDIMKSKDDVFKSIAARWEKLPENEITEKQRNTVKQICYGIIYGMGIKSLTEALKCSESEAIAFNESFHKTYPGIRIYLEKIVNFVRRNGYIETITGRRRYFNKINSENIALRSLAERQAINTVIQGSAADICKYSILRMERNLCKYQNILNINLSNDRRSSVCNFVLHLHDELIYEVSMEKCKQIAKILKSSMENCVKLNIPLMVKLKTGTNWGNLMSIEL